VLFIESWQNIGTKLTILWQRMPASLFN